MYFSSAGWTTHHLFKGATERDRDASHARLCYQLKQWLEKIRLSPYAWPFKEPVNTVEVGLFNQYTVVVYIITT